MGCEPVACWSLLIALVRNKVKIILMYRFRDHAASISSLYPVKEGEGCSLEESHSGLEVLSGCRVLKPDLLVLMLVLEVT